MIPEPDREDSSDFSPSADDPLREPPSMDDMEKRRARSAIEGRLFSGPAQPVRVGRYRIEGRIGAGGMGVVYRAHDPELARDVAVKLMHPDAASGADEKTARARLVREARAMARLAHPNVIHVYDVGTVEDGVFIAMELVDGESLASWQHAAPRDWRAILAVCLDAGRGLAAAHAAGVVHRDFKPENVLVGADGRARVGDFGLAGGAVPSTGPQEVADGLDSTAARSGRGSDRANTLTAASSQDGDLARAPIDSLSAGVDDEDSELGAAISGALTRTGMLLGTPKYMAPEQEIGGAASPLADQFSFCVALYEALYGRPPYGGETVAAYRKNVHEQRVDPPPPDTKVRAWVHAQIVTGLSVDPEARHASMDALIDRLDAAVIDPSRARRQGRRRRVIFGAVVGLLGVATAAAAGIVLSPASDGAGRIVVVPGAVRSAASETGTVDAARPEAVPIPSNAEEPSTTSTSPAVPPVRVESADTDPAAPFVDKPEPRPATHNRTVGPGERRAPKKTQTTCYFIEDHGDFITESRRGSSQLRDAGVCWSCRKAPNPSGLYPSSSSGLAREDCKAFLVCHEDKDACEPS